MLKTIEELSYKLQQMQLQEKPDQRIEIAIHQSNKVYPVAYVNVSGLSSNGSVTRIDCWLPDNTHTVKRKEKVGA